MENYGTPAPATGNKKLVALMCYCGMMWVIGLLADEYKDDPFVKKHVNAGIQLTFSIFALILVNIIPILGQIVFCIAMIALLIFYIMGIVKAITGKDYVVPIIGEKFTVIH